MQVEKLKSHYRRNLQFSLNFFFHIDSNQFCLSS